ncbi:hypothetical protein BH10PSE2_BH10PSE2_16850 [soil metagenome]
MLLFALLISGLSGPVAAPAVPASAAQQHAYTALSGEIYAPPVVRPYEPPSNFGRQIAEGDADATVRTGPITGPVAVEAYTDTYEPRRSRRELSYEQGVETARTAQNARMGPLDGVWRVVDADGRPVLGLVLSDQGSGHPVEGALRFDRSDNTAVVEVASAEGGGTVISAPMGGRTVALRLRPWAGGWSGELTGLGRDQQITLDRPAGWTP